MPHVILKIATGRSDTEKAEVAAAFVSALQDILGIEEKHISVAVEDVPALDWMEKVYIPDIQSRPEIIYKEPGYGLD